MDRVLYWIWLTSKSVISPNKIMSLLERYGSADEIYREREYRNVPNIGEKELAVLRDKSMSSAEHIREVSERIGSRIVTFEDEDYPDKLRNITAPPYILYVRGDISGLDDTLTIGVIGSRHYTAYGEMVTTRMSSELARNGVIIVSGLARGLDTSAARGALKAGGRTIAVIGSGLDNMYPPENAGIADEISERGAVITEYPPSSPPLAMHFPARNRIIAGLSNGLLVTEAGRKSGTLITAGLALEYGRDLFVVPGRINEQNYEGSNRLIQQGAKLTVRVSDILEEYPYARRVKPALQAERSESEKNGDAEAAENTPDKDGEVSNTAAISEIKKTEDNERYKDLSEADRKILSLIMTRAVSIDEISRAVGMNAGEVNVRLTVLEMKKYIKRLPGGYYDISG